MTPSEASRHILQYMQSIPVLPVLSVDDVRIARTLALTLVEAGAPVIEVTLRTPNALAVIEAMAAVDGATIAAGTVLNRMQLQQAQLAGAQFVVSPGCTDDLIAAADHYQIPLLPGAATASEVMLLAEKGYHLMKFFPAQAMGGAVAISAFASPFSHVKFCPTGGINAHNINEYLSLSNVPFVGASYMVSKQDIQGREWRKIAAKIRMLTTPEE
ncbi:bifunctional 4-hydroxy-2-oxoglutarate aldolase/2-dehydro-3-deoxy-phosphogluconate aldolase [Eionea flava]